MTKKQYLQVFQTLTKCIFTVLTAEAAWLFAMTYGLLTETGFCITAYRQIPLCVEHLAAGMVIYVILATASVLAVQEYGT